MRIETARPPSVKGHTLGEYASDERIPNEVQTSLSVIISAGEILESYFDRLTSEQRRLALQDILGAARRMDDWMQEFSAPQLIISGKTALSGTAAGQSKCKSGSTTRRRVRPDLAAAGLHA